MSDPAGITIAVFAALAAAGSFGVAAALQHRQVQLACSAGALAFRLLSRLAGMPHRDHHQHVASRRHVASRHPRAAR